MATMFQACDSDFSHLYSVFVDKFSIFGVIAMRGYLDRVVTEKALAHLNAGSDFDDGDVESVLLKNVCAKVSVKLSDDIDNVVGFLGISKRCFLEAAFIDAVATAHEIIHRELGIPLEASK